MVTAKEIFGNLSYAFKKAISEDAVPILYVKEKPHIEAIFKNENPRARKKYVSLKRKFFYNGDIQSDKVSKFNPCDNGLKISTPKSAVIIEEELWKEILFQHKI